MEQKMDKAALYLRLSKEDIDKMSKGDDSESIVNQRLLLTDFAVSRGIQIVDIYSDDDYSGLYDDRPEFNRLIRDSKLGKFNMVISKSQSRFTRNMEHMEKYLHHDFPLLGIRFMGVVDGTDTQVKENKKARQIYGLTNEWYCEDLSENIRAVFRQKMKAGQYLGGFAPYGYDKDPEDKYKFVIDEPAACVVRQIYGLFLSGYSIKSICSILEDDNIPGPSLYKKRKGLTYRNVRADDFSIKYGLWSETTVKRILSNETYTGILQQGTQHKMSYKDKKIIPVPREEWIVVPDHHAPIIAQETFRKVQRLREKRRISTGNRADDKKVHLFAGKLRCASCGHTMIKSGGVSGNKKDWYLRCQLANKTRKKQCSSHNIRYSEIEKAVRDRMRSIVWEVLEDSAGREALNLLLSARRNSGNCKDLEKLRKTAEEITKTMKLLYCDRAAGRISEEMFFELKESFEAEHTKCIIRLRQFPELQPNRRPPEEIQSEERKSEQLLPIEKISPEKRLSQGKTDRTAIQYDNFQLTYELVNDFIDYIEITEKNKETDRQEIIIHWNF